MVSIKKAEYAGWKNCVQVSNGIIDFVATTDVGPRIIRFGFVNKENHFCEVKDQVGKIGGDEWNIYGGHRLWHSPESQVRTFERDNFPVEWEEIPNGLRLMPSLDKVSNIRKIIEITMSPDKAEVTVVHKLENAGVWPVELAAWALSVMAAGGKEILPVTQKQTGLLPNRALSLWPYTKMNDPRVYWGEKYITLQQDVNAKTPFKFGMPNEDGWAAYANYGQLFVIKYDHEADEIYPDFGFSSYETYTNDFMLEMESLGPLVILEPGDGIDHTEVWNLFDNVAVPQNETEIHNLVTKLIK